MGTVRQRAQERRWSLIAGGLTGEERRQLLTLLAVPAEATERGLERLRRGPVKPSADGMVGTLLRLRELRALLVDARTARPRRRLEAGRLSERVELGQVDRAPGYLENRMLVAQALERARIGGVELFLKRRHERLRCLGQPE